MRFGIRLPVMVGMLLFAAGLALFTVLPVDGSFVPDISGMLLLGIGCGFAHNAVILAAMNDVSADETGLASGVVDTSFMMGGALGLAVLASLAAAYGGGRQDADERTGGCHAAFAAASPCARLATVVGAWLPRKATAASPANALAGTGGG